MCELEKIEQSATRNFLFKQFFFLKKTKHFGEMVGIFGLVSVCLSAQAVGETIKILSKGEGREASL